jgi:hypothetical protein
METRIAATMTTDTAGDDEDGAAEGEINFFCLQII